MMRGGRGFAGSKFILFGNKIREKIRIVEKGRMDRNLLIPKILRVVLVWGLKEGLEV